MGITVNGTGRALPVYQLDNSAMEQMVDTSNEWIVSRTGIESRHIAIKEMGLDLAAAAARKACGWEEGGWVRTPVKPDEIGLVIVATVTPDAIVPSMSSQVKKTLQLPNAVAFDINAACSGFIYGTWLAQSLMQTGLPVPQVAGKKALVIGVERLSRIVDWTDRGTCVLFGDGAGAAILSAEPDQIGIMGSFIKNYDDMADSLTVGMDYTPLPFDEKGPISLEGIPCYWEKETMKLRMDGKSVFKFAVHAMVEVMERVLEDTGVNPDEIAYFVPHQANIRIIKAAAQRFNQPLEKFQMNMHHTGNSSAASIPMALAELMESGRVKPGDKVMMAGFGGGLSAGAILFQVPGGTQDFGDGADRPKEKGKVTSGFLRTVMNESDRM